MIVVGVDGSPGGAAALAWGLDEAARRGCGIVAVRVCTWRAPELLDAAPYKERLLEEMRVLSGTVDDVARLRPGHWRIDGRLAAGDAAEALMKIVEEYGADLLVVGTRGLGHLAGVVVRSISRRCATHATCTVVVVPASFDRRSCRRIVVGIDDGPESVETLRWAADEAASCSARLSVVHVFAPRVLDDVADAYAEATDTIARIVDKAFDQTSSRPPIERLTFEGRPASELLTEATYADLLVVGGPSRPGVAAVLGSVAMECLEHAVVPVAVRRGAFNGESLTRSSSS